MCVCIYTYDCVHAYTPYVACASNLPRNLPIFKQRMYPAMYVALTLRM